MSRDRICHLVKYSSIPDTLASSCLPSPVPGDLTLPTSDPSAHEVIDTCACMHPKTACSHGCWESRTRQTMLVHSRPLQECFPPRGQKTYLERVCLCFLPCLTNPFLSRTPSPVSDHCSFPQGLEKANLSCCLPRHSGKDCTLFQMPSVFTRGFRCSVASVWLMTRQLGTPQQRVFECFPLPP